MPGESERQGRASDEYYQPSAVSFDWGTRGHPECSQFAQYITQILQLMRRTEGREFTIGSLPHKPLFTRMIKRSRTMRPLPEVPPDSHSGCHTGGVGMCNGRH